MNDSSAVGTVGNGHGINTVTLIDCRFAGPAEYMPAHTKQGAAKETPAQANFTVYQNIGDRKMEFRITAWGKMADVIAKGGATGKQIHLLCSVHSYRGRVWFPTPEGAQRQFVLRADGQPLMETKIGFTLERMSFGNDSAKTIQEEIQRNFRPQGWNDPTQPGYQEWRNRCAQNNALQFQPGMEWYGYAKVKPVDGAISSGNRNNGGFQGGQQQGQAQPYQQNQQNQGFQGAAPNNQGYQGFQNQGQSVNVNGQYVGQAMPNQQNNMGYAPQNQNQYNGGYQGGFQGGNQNQNANNGVVM